MPPMICPQLPIITLRILRFTGCPPSTVMVAFTGLPGSLRMPAST